MLFLSIVCTCWFPSCFPLNSFYCCFHSILLFHPPINGVQGRSLLPLHNTYIRYFASLCCTTPLIHVWRPFSSVPWFLLRYSDTYVHISPFSSLIPFEHQFSCIIVTLITLPHYLFLISVLSLHLCPHNPHPSPSLFLNPPVYLVYSRDPSCSTPPSVSPVCLSTVLPPLPRLSSLT